MTLVNRAGDVLLDAEEVEIHGSVAMQHPDAPVNFDFLCVKEHVTSAIYECHPPSERPRSQWSRPLAQSSVPACGSSFHPTICTSSTTAGIAWTIAFCPSSTGAAS